MVSNSAKLWFADRSSRDGCTSVAILNVYLNVEEADVGEVQGNEKSGFLRPYAACSLLHPLTI